jgi:hypothetical protein
VSESASHRFPFSAESGLEGELTGDQEASNKVLKDGSGFIRVIKVLNVDLICSMTHELEVTAKVSIMLLLEGCKTVRL